MRIPYDMMNSYPEKFPCLEVSNDKIWGTTDSGTFQLISGTPSNCKAQRRNYQELD